MDVGNSTNARNEQDEAVSNTNTISGNRKKIKYVGCSKDGNTKLKHQSEKGKTVCSKGKYILK